MFDKRDSCYMRKHKECYCGAMEEDREEFEPYDQEELDLYNYGLPPEEKLTMAEVQARVRE